MEDDSFPVYGGLSRTAMVMGVPLVPLVMIGGACMVTATILIPLFGLKALLLFLIPIPIVIAMKTLSKNDDQAINIIGYEILCFVKSKNRRMFNGTNTILGTQYGRPLNDYQRYYEELGKSALARQLFTQNQSARHP